MVQFGNYTLCNGMEANLAIKCEVNYEQHKNYKY